MNTTAQPATTYADEPSKLPPPAAPAEVAALVRFLQGRAWTFARDIISARPPGVNLPDNLEAAKRKLRVLVKASDAKIVSAPGSPGYCVFEETTDQEIDRVLNARNSQIDEEKNDVKAIARRQETRNNRTHEEATFPLTAHEHASLYS